MYLGVSIEPDSVIYPLINDADRALDPLRMRGVSPTNV